MASPVELYQKEMHKNVGFFATWLPASSVELGDIGVIEGGRFRRVASLGEFGIPLSGVREGNAENVSYSAAASRNDGASVSAGIPAAVGEGELRIEFTSEGGFVFEALGMRNIEVGDRLALADGMLEIHGRGKWEPQWFVIESLYRARSATIIVSQESASEIVLKASAKLPSGALPLADPKLGLKVSSSQGKVVHLVAANNLSPLYSCVKIRESIFSAPKVVPVLGSSAKNSAQSLSRASIDDLLNS